MSFNSGLNSNHVAAPANVIVYINKESNGNIDNICVYPNPSTFTDLIWCKCKVCGKELKLQVDADMDFKFNWSDYLKTLADFAYDHRHQIVSFIKKPGVFTEPNQEFVKIKPGQVVQINGKAFDVVADLGEKTATATYTQPEVPLTVRTEVVVQEFVNGRRFRDAE